MLCYRDITFCASKVEKHTCGREFTEQDAIDAEKWWGGKDYPVAYGYLCNKKKYTCPGLCKEDFDTRQELVDHFCFVAK